jgi:hypothetical protein
VKALTVAAFSFKNYFDDDDPNCIRSFFCDFMCNKEE